MTESITKRMQSFSYAPDLYADIPTTHDENHTAGGAMAGKLSITSAPEVISPKEDQKVLKPVPNEAEVTRKLKEDIPRDLYEPKKKKYAKEAWPGKKPGPNLLSV